MKRLMNNQFEHEREIVLDTETTGLNPHDGHRIIEIGCVELKNKIPTGNNFHVYINPERNIPYDSYQVHGITEEFLEDKPKFNEVVTDFKEFIADSPLIIHNVGFDLKFLNYELNLLNLKTIPWAQTIDTLLIARKMFPRQKASLDALCMRFNIDLSERSFHGALKDSILLAKVYLELCGGSQTGFEFDQKNKQKTRSQQSAKLNKTKIYPVRNIAISNQEKAEHRKLLKNIKAPIWNKYIDENA